MTYGTAASQISLRSDPGIRGVGPETALEPTPAQKYYCDPELRAKWTGTTEPQETMADRREICVTFDF